MYRSTFAHLHAAYAPPTGSAQTARGRRRWQLRAPVRRRQGRPSSSPASVSPTSPPIASRS
jgi:hypothetical protein